MAIETILEARDVRKTFGTFEAVRGLSLDIRKGECFGLLGPNGAGKSTFINMIYGSVLRSRGDLKVFGLDPQLDARSIKKRLGVVTQDNALDESLNVTENMELYAAFVGVAGKDRKSRVDDLLNFMNLSHKKSDPIRFLSGGMKRRLVFVRALLGNPDLVILDEPTTGLDPAVRHLLWGRINDLKNKGKTILLTTHYMHEAEVLCDRLVIMNQGQVIGEGSPASLRDRYSPGFVAVFDKAGAQEVESIHTLAQKLNYKISEDSSGVYVRAPELNALIKFQEELKQPALHLRPSNLEDVFLQLTGQELTADA